MEIHDSIKFGINSVPYMKGWWDMTTYEQSLAMPMKDLPEMAAQIVGLRPVTVAAALGAIEMMKWHDVPQDNLKLMLKGDDTPVTRADQDSAHAVRGYVSKFYPMDRINEEEFGDTGSGKNTWYVDPIDGTSSFVRGQRYSTVGVAVYPDPVFAIINPFEDEVLCSGNGGVLRGKYSDVVRFINLPCSHFVDHAGNPNLRMQYKNVSVSTKPLEGGIIYVDALFNKKTSPRKLEFIRRLVELTGGKLGVRMTGSNIDQQRQVACGRAELTLTDAVGGYWDIVVGGTAIEQAGGKFVGVDGGAIHEKSQVALGGPAEIVDQVLPILMECYKDYDGFR